MTSGRMADLLGEIRLELEAHGRRLAALEVLQLHEAICPPAAAGDLEGSCSRCATHRAGYHTAQKYAAERAKMPALRAESQARLEEHFRRYPAEPRVRVTAPKRAVETEGAAIDDATDERLAAMGATWLARDYRGRPRASGISFARDGQVVERADLLAERLALDPQLAHAVTVGHLVVTALGEDECRAIAARERDLVRVLGLVL